MADTLEPRAEKRSRRSRSPKRSLGARIRLLASAVAVLAVVCAVGFGALLLYLNSQPLPAAHVPQTSQILDAEGKLIRSFYTGENRTIVPLTSISKWLIQATLAVEDRRFYEHNGFDFRGLARAVTVNVKTLSKAQGASTLTQQLARNLYLNHDRTWTRKIKEAFYTLQLELKLSKDEILESYLNEIYYGHSAYGAEAASQMFFGKPAKDLTLAESAMLAGIPKGPRYYSPYLDWNNAKSRQELILDLMDADGYITPEQALEAKREILALQPRKTGRPLTAGYFVDYVKQQAQEKLGVTEEQFEQGGYIIQTTLDLNAQQAAEEIVAKELEDKPELQAALVAVDPRNGHIRAMVGGRNYADNQFNRALSAARQPGSAFKAFVYLAALQQPGFTPSTRFMSEPTSFAYDEGRKLYTPSNYNNKYENRRIDLRTAIAKSDNIYAVSTIRMIGEQHVIDLARRLGISGPMDPVPSLALGSFGVSPLEMASAYGAIANLGIRAEPTAILRIRTADGQMLYEHVQREASVVSPAAAYVLTDAMTSVFEPGGTGYRVAAALKRPVAGKSGTTNSDAWMVGYTPELSTAVWVGYDRGRTIDAIESYKAAPIFAEFTERALAAIPPKLFPMPEGVTTVYVDPASGKLAAPGCGESQLMAFVSGTEPTEYCDGRTRGSGDIGGPGSGSDHPGSKNGSWWEDLRRWWNG
ncbi:transglycosylase domain-containing protein [Paenibacillus thermoaerophilus]|uniref:Transglycosylase domain-containing protein n=1 Tax=Paenibacillus thermoaerophilus TaxID=1215385 RepID=A0ABW2V4P4_9BACL|nr:PBP1A family penicillin-binding protein [Paenibacillus thermoaerophilus]TMV14406.1 PBP1A family penicillin-binding protein [Paenibacillus thermoaerophilus]